MSCTLRDAVSADASASGSVCYEAFRSISDAHNFPADFPSVDFTAELLGMLIGTMATIRAKSSHILPHAEVLLSWP